MGLTPGLRVGVLLALPVHFLDVLSVDLFDMLTEEYLKSCNLPNFVTDFGRDVEIHYIGAASGKDSVRLTTNRSLSETDTIRDAAVAPGKLDVLIIPGLSPTSAPSYELRKFVKDHSDAGATLLVSHTGAFAAGYSGVLKGKKASGPQALVPKLRELFPDTTWDSSPEFVADGNIWSNGESADAHCMTAAYIAMLYPGPLSETVCGLANIGTREDADENINPSDNL